MIPGFDDFPEGANVDAQCNSCGAKNVPIRIRAQMVPQQKRPQNLVPAIVIQATRKPPTITEVIGDKMVERVNPECDLLDVVTIATWEIVEEICESRDCFHNTMDRLWNLGQRRLDQLWDRKK